MIQVERAAVDFQGGSGPVLPSLPVSLSVQWGAGSCGFLCVCVWLQWVARSCGCCFCGSGQEWGPGLRKRWLMARSRGGIGWNEDSGRASARWKPRCRQRANRLQGGGGRGQLLQQVGFLLGPNIPF